MFAIHHCQALSGGWQMFRHLLCRWQAGGGHGRVDLRYRDHDGAGLSLAPREVVKTCALFQTEGIRSSEKNIFYFEALIFSKILPYFPDAKY